MSTRAVEGGTPGRHLSERQEETVSGLLDATLAELRRCGFDDLTVRSVAAAAGVAPATAYNYFASKEHLVAEVFWRRLRALEQPDGHGRSATERVTDALEGVALLVADDPALSSACTVAMLGSDPEVRRLRDRIGADVHRRIVEALGDDRTDAVVDALDLAWSGAMLRVGMGHLDYRDLVGRLSAVVSLVCAPQNGADANREVTP